MERKKEKKGKEKKKRKEEKKSRKEMKKVTLKYTRADKSLARPGRKQADVSVRMA